MRFNGPSCDPDVDGPRLEKQHDRVRNAMADHAWRTLDEIAAATGDPVASVSAQLRHLRKPRFGGFLVEKRIRGARGSGLYEYRVLAPPPPGQLRLELAIEGSR